MHHSIRKHLALVPFALVLLAPAARGGEADALPPAVRDAKAQCCRSSLRKVARRRPCSNIAASCRNIRRRARPSTRRRVPIGARSPRSGEAATPSGASGQQITLDDYVLPQPPLYTGPKRPVKSGAGGNAGSPDQKADTGGRRSPAGGAPSNYQFTPQRPASEVEFKRAYARYALASGLTREQAVRVYSFETGGTGNYDVQAGYRAWRHARRSRPRWATTSS